MPADAQVPNADPNQEVIFDGAKRDRIVWQGDLAVQAPETYLSSDDASAVDNALSSRAAPSQAPATTRSPRWPRSSCRTAICRPRASSASTTATRSAPTASTSPGS